MAEGPSLRETPVRSHARECAPLGLSSPPRIPPRGQADSAALRRPFQRDVAWPGLAATRGSLLSDETCVWGNHSASFPSWQVRMVEISGKAHLWVSVLSLSSVALSSCPIQSFVVLASPWEDLDQSSRPVLPALGGSLPSHRSQTGYPTLEHAFEHSKFITWDAS